jgi:hypothetical protein
MPAAAWRAVGHVPQRLPLAATALRFAGAEADVRARLAFMNALVAVVNDHASTPLRGVGRGSPFGCGL